MTDFMFIEFNPRRAARGVGAARVEVTEDGTKYLLWMNIREINLNLKLHGQHNELLKAREAYKNG